MHTLIIKQTYRYCSSLLFTLLACSFAYADTARVVESIAVQPRRAYALRFEVAGTPAAGDRWLLHLRDGAGRLPYDGVLAGEWQRLDAPQGEHQHWFYSPAQAATLQVVLQAKSGVTLRNIRLEEIQSDNLVINGDFSAGENNYSGWNERYNAELTRREYKEREQTVLLVAQNGFALTDYIPVEPGAQYRLSLLQGAPGMKVLAYDVNRRFLQDITQDPRDRRAPLQIPAQVAYLRVLYETGFDHLETWRENAVRQVQVTLHEPAQERVVWPTYEESADWEIVLAAGCDGQEEQAARELQHWMLAISGKLPPLQAEPSANASRKIFVGRAWADAFAGDLQKLGRTDGYAVRSKDRNIYVFGAKPRGTLYGVHNLLERNTDIIWPRPNPEFEAIFSKRDKLELAEADYISIPVFEKRHVSRAGHHHNQYVFQRWHARNALNTPWSLHQGLRYLIWRDGATLGYQRSYLTLIENIDESMRPLIDGVRDESRWRHPCFTHPDVPKAMADGVRRMIASLPGKEMEHFSSSIEDNWLVCNCENCMSPIQLPNGETLAPKSGDSTKDPLFFSTRNTMMLNQMAEELAQDYPDLKILSLAYIFTAEPPQVPVHPMIISQYAAYPTKNERYPLLSGEGQQISIYDKEIWKRRFEQWGQLKKGELGMFGYYYTPGFNALADTAAADFRALAEFEAVQAMTEGFPVDGEELSNWDLDSIEKWVITKLMWDPQQDPQALREEYIRRVYRGAEKEMGEFYGLIRKAWHEAPKNVFVNCHTSARDLFQNLIVGQGIENEMKDALAAALSQATDAKGKQLIQRHIDQMNRIAASLGRYTVPYVEESAHDWKILNSPHWEKAVVVEEFRKVDDWRQLDKALAEQQTQVRLMHDKHNLYVRFDGEEATPAALVKPAIPAGIAYPQGDRYELILRSERGQSYYLALGPGGHFFASPYVPEEWGKRIFVQVNPQSWTAVMAIPLILMGPEELQKSMQARLGRVWRLDPEIREESSHNGTSIFDPHENFWLNLELERR